MIVRIAIALAVLFTLGPGADGAHADEAAAWDALRAGGHIALMRHTSAPGAGDPPGFALDDCSTQRNLSETGRADAAAIGERIRSEGVAFQRILSSPWCRCMETARLMDLGPIQIEATFSNAFVLSDQREALTAGARALIQAWRGPGTLLVVTHGANIRPLTGVSPASGEILVVAIRAGGSIEVIGRIPPPR